MRFPVSSILVAIVIVGSVVRPARGESISGTLSGDSTLTPTATPGNYDQSFTGGGLDKDFGAFTFSSKSSIDFSNPPNILLTGGSFVETFTKGTLVGTSSGTGIASGKGTATVSIDLVITGGTGQFSGDTGTATFVGTITSTSPTTESLTGSYEGKLSTVPEPSTFALLGVGGMGLAIGAYWRRRLAAV